MKTLPLAVLAFALVLAYSGVACLYGDGRNETPGDNAGDFTPDDDSGDDAGDDFGDDTGDDSGDDSGPEGSIDFVDVDMPTDLTADGGVALLQDTASGTGDVYLYDTAARDLTLVTSTGDFEHPITAIAGDGSRIVGFHGMPIQAGVWSEADGWLDLSSPFADGCDPNLSSGWDLSGDGLVAVGLAWDGCAHTQAFRWTDESGPGVFTLLAKSAFGYDRATVVSADGLVAAGFAGGEFVDRSPVVWRADGSRIDLDPTGEVVGEVLSITPDGSKVAGIWNLDAFAWTEAGGVVVLGKLDGAMPTDTAWPNAIAADGRLVTGGCGDPFWGGVQAFVWTDADGMRPLAPIVAAAGLTVPEGVSLTNVIAASEDGTVLLGFTQDQVMAQGAFVLHLPLSAYGL
jgi:hypothetical protein